MEDREIKAEKWEVFMEVLSALADEPESAPDMMQAKGLITKIYKQARKDKRRNQKELKRTQDKLIKESTGRCQLEAFHPVTQKLINGSEANQFSRVLNKPQPCYICKKKYTLLDHFYHLLCPECSEINHSWRNKEVDFSGMTVLVTGARIKIGYEVSLRLLRSGARVIGSSRFPKDAGLRYTQEPDFDEWKDRLELHALDLRDLPSVKTFADRISRNHNHLDCIINNAAQTLKRPLEYEQNLLIAENELTKLDCVHTITDKKAQLGEGLKEYEILYDYDNELIDDAVINSWKLTLEDVSVLELLETHLITSFAPFILNSQLKPLLTQDKASFIVNVTAMEGQFSRENKTHYHPHTNMAKASMNMMTRTCAQDYATEGIYMNSVDTGWITNENPRAQKLQQRGNGFVPPLDIVDGAVRVLAPMINGLEGKLEFGKFYKDYCEHEW